MNQQIQDDLKLFKKAKRRVNAMLVFSYLLLGLWNAALYFLLTQPLFERPHSFLILYLTSMLAQMILWMMIFFALSEGKPKLRLLLILGILAQIGWCGFLGYDLFQNTNFILFYVLWIAMELVQVFYLLWLRGWLKNSWWARIFFDHVVELEGDEEEQILQPTQPLQQTIPNGYPSMNGYGQAMGYQNGYPNTYPNFQQGNYGYVDQQGYPQPNYGYPQGQNQQPYPPQGQPGYDPMYGYPQNANFAQNGYSQPQQNGYPNEGYEDSYETLNESPYVTPASNFAGNPDITQHSEADSDREEYEEQPVRKKFPFFSSHKEEVQEAQFTNQGPIDFQTDAQIEALRQQEASRREAYEVSQSYSYIAMRMAAVVYGELVLFPILINLFQNNFVSIDNSSVFAINLMFTLCILTAVVWTLPIFFLYLKQPGVKKILWGAALFQVGVAAFGLWMLHGYYDAQTIHYADKVFTYFLMAEVLRYGLLIAGIFPAFQLPSIQDIHYELEEEDFDDPHIVLELVSEEDPESDEDQNEEVQLLSDPSLAQEPSSINSSLKNQVELSKGNEATSSEVRQMASNPAKPQPSSASFLEIDDIISEKPISNSSKS